MNLQNAKNKLFRNPANSKRMLIEGNGSPSGSTERMAGVWNGRSEVTNEYSYGV